MSETQEKLHLFQNEAPTIRLLIHMLVSAIWVAISNWAQWRPGSLEALPNISPPSLKMEKTKLEFLPGHCPWRSVYLSLYVFPVWLMVLVIMWGCSPVSVQRLGSMQAYLSELKHWLASGREGGRRGWRCPVCTSGRHVPPSVLYIPVSYIYLEQMHHVTQTWFQLHAGHVWGGKHINFHLWPLQANQINSLLYLTTTSYVDFVYFD